MTKKPTPTICERLADLEDMARCMHYAARHIIDSLETDLRLHEKFNINHQIGG